MSDGRSVYPDQPSAPYGTPVRGLARDGHDIAQLQRALDVAYEQLDRLTREKAELQRELGARGTPATPVAVRPGGDAEPASRLQERTKHLEESLRRAAAEANEKGKELVEVAQKGRVLYEEHERLKSQSAFEISRLAAEKDALGLRIRELELGKVGEGTPTATKGQVRNELGRLKEELGRAKESHAATVGAALERERHYTARISEIEARGTELQRRLAEREGDIEKLKAEFQRQIKKVEEERKAELEANIGAFAQQSTLANQAIRAAEDRRQAELTAITEASATQSTQSNQAIRRAADEMQKISVLVGSKATTTDKLIEDIAALKHAHENLSSEMKLTLERMEAVKQAAERDIANKRAEVDALNARLRVASEEKTALQAQLANMTAQGGQAVAGMRKQLEDAQKRELELSQQITAASMRIQAAEAGLAASSVELERQATELERFKRLVDDSNGRLEDEKKKSLDTQEALAELQKKHEDEMARGRGALRQLRNEIGRLTDAEKLLMGEKTDLLARLDKANLAVASIGATVAATRDQLSALATEHVALQRQHVVLSAEHSSAQSSLNAARTNAEELQAELSRTQAARADLQTQLDAAKASININQRDLTEKLGALQSRIGELERGIESANGAASEHGRNAERLRAQVAEAETRLSSVEAEKRALGEQLVGLTAEKTQFKERCEQLANKVVDMTQELELFGERMKSLSDSAGKAKDDTKDDTSDLHRTLSVLLSSIESVASVDGLKNLIMDALAKRGTLGRSGPDGSRNRRATVAPSDLRKGPTGRPGGRKNGGAGGKQAGRPEGNLGPVIDVEMDDADMTYNGEQLCIFGIDDNVNDPPPSFSEVFVSINDEIHSYRPTPENKNGLLADAKRVAERNKNNRGIWRWQDLAVATFNQRKIQREESKCPLLAKSSIAASVMTAPAKNAFPLVLSTDAAEYSKAIRDSAELATTVFKGATKVLNEHGVACTPSAFVAFRKLDYNDGDVLRGFLCLDLAFPGDRFDRMWTRSVAGYHFRSILANAVAARELPTEKNWKEMATVVFKHAWWIENVRKTAFPQREDAPRDVSVLPAIAPIVCPICETQYRPKATSVWETLNTAAADVLRQRTRCSWVWAAWAAFLKDVVAFVASHCDSACVSDEKALELARTQPLHQ
jgi:hypothetical protein